jgi:hypothetical protein
VSSPAHSLSPSDDLVEHPLASVREIVRRVREAEALEKCDMCAVIIGDVHRHVVDIEERTLRCLCPPCYLLFSDPAAAHGRYRQVPHRYRVLTDVNISQGDWDALQIPVGLAFFFTNSSIERTVAFYPGPAGATESLLPLDAWQRLTGSNPDLAAVEPDVEAVLVRRHGDDVDCYLVPIDACYELVGKLRMTWVGFDGGAEARTEVANFFARLQERSGA